MVASIRYAAVCGLIVAVALGAAGCNGAAPAKAGSQPRNVRLLEDENYRLGEQVKTLQKQIEAMKAETAATADAGVKDKVATEETMTYMMDIIAARETENKALQDKVATLEKELAALKVK